MMKFTSQLALIATVILQIGFAMAWPHGSAPFQNRSELVLNGLPPNQEYVFLNNFKTRDVWNYGDNSGQLPPTDLDSNGYPIAGGAWIAKSGAKTTIYLPSQFERPGHNVITWTGAGKFQFGANGASNTSISCSGVVTGEPACNNSGCSAFTAKIDNGSGGSGTTLTVTAAPTGTGCTLGAGVPITGTGVTLSTFGTPTIITSAGSACGGNTCYTVNIAQFVASESMQMGGRFEVSSVDGGPLNQQFLIQELTTTVGNQASNIAVFHINDESGYWSSATPCGGAQAKACILGSLFRTRVSQLHPAVIRDLNLVSASTTNCTTWSTRRPILYSGYGPPEMRNAASGPGQYVNSAGSGASGGTVSANHATLATFTGSISGTTLHVTALLTGSLTGVVGTVITGTGVVDPGFGSTIIAQITTQGGDIATYTVGNSQTVASTTITSAQWTYTITLGAGAPVDKQTVLWLPPSSGDNSSVINFNGTVVPILTSFGTPLYGGSGYGIPLSTVVGTLVYDAVMGGFLDFGVGLDCGVPPEVFVEINAELGTTPWHDPGMMSLDPMTDWVTQYATYIKNNYSTPLPPRFEATNEPWNGAGGTFPCQYFSAKSTKYIAEDSAWVSGFFCGPTGNAYGEVGKILSTMGQDLNTVFGAGNYVLLAPVQTGYLGSSVATDVLQSPGYVNQTIAPTQAGYTKTPAYQYATNLSLTTYWNTGYYNQSSVIGTETGIAYCYYNYSISTPCQGLYASQEAAMQSKVNSAVTNLGNGIINIYTLNNTLFPQWKTFGLNCGGVSRPASCVVSQTSPLMAYEGGYQEVAQTSDVTQSVTSATNAATAVLAVASNGCVAGQTVALSSLTGGTWSTAAGSYTVQATGTDGSHCAINLNSTGLGTLSSATLTYTGSTNYITYLRKAAYQDPLIDTYTTALYQDFLNNGGSYPSQFDMASTYDFNSNSATGWLVLDYDLYGYSNLAQSSASTISSTTMTLGGTIKGVFAIGQTIAGPGVTGVGTGAGSNTTIISCTRNGTGPCGTNVGDTLGLSQASTVSVGTQIWGHIAPPANASGNSTTSPNRAWGAICRFNGNGAQCNG